MDEEKIENLRPPVPITPEKLKKKYVFRDRSTFPL